MYPHMIKYCLYLYIYIFSLEVNMMLKVLLLCLQYRYLISISNSIYTWSWWHHFTSTWHFYIFSIIVLKGAIINKIMITYINETISDMSTMISDSIFVHLVISWWFCSSTKSISYHFLLINRCLLSKLSGTYMRGKAIIHLLIQSIGFITD